jgi:hypothetical protein
MQRFTGIFLLLSMSFHQYFISFDMNYFTELMELETLFITYTEVYIIFMDLSITVFMYFPH